MAGKGTDYLKNKQVDKGKHSQNSRSRIRYYENTSYIFAHVFLFLYFNFLGGVFSRCGFSVSSWLS